MIVPRRAVAGSSLALLVLIVCLAASAPVTNQTYTVDGSDTYQIGGRNERSEIAYRGVQHLVIEQTGRDRRYSAKVRYLRNDQGTHERVTASFQTTIGADGEQQDGTNEDPDYLTILNQPFSVQLDPATIHDLARLTGAVPFDFPSPMTGAPLHGTLRRAGSGMRDGQHVIGVAFDAGGPLHGALPDHPVLTLTGTIRMSGTAYYTADAALLVDLEATLTISGHVDDAARHDPVEIVYKRTIRAVPPIDDANLAAKHPSKTPVARRHAE